MPGWLIPLLLAAGTGAQVGSSIHQSNKNREAQKESDKNSLEIAKMGDERERALALLELLANENMANPYRHLLSQGGAAAMFDQMARETPVSYRLPENSRYAQYVNGVTREGGYEPSPELRRSAEQLRNNVLSGQHVAPSATDPNAPRYGTIDLLTQIGLGDHPIAPHGGPVGGARPTAPPWGTPNTAVPRPGGSVRHPDGYTRGGAGAMAPGAELGPLSFEGAGHRTMPVGRGSAYAPMGGTLRDETTGEEATTGDADLMALLASLDARTMSPAGARPGRPVARAPMRRKRRPMAARGGPAASFGTMSFAA